MDLSQAKLLWHMCWFEAQRFRAYPLEIAASLFSRIAELSLYATFWLIVGQFGGSSNINGKDVIAYYLIISGLVPFFSSAFGVASMTIDYIKTGKLSQSLIRPINPILFPWAIRNGRNIVAMAFGVVQITLGMVLSGGMKPAALPFLLPVIINSFAINTAFNIMLGASAFYLTESRGIKNTFLHIASFFRGEKMPLHLMPPGLMNFLLLTPFPASQYHLTILLQGTRLPTWSDVLIGCAWSIVLLVVAVKMWQRGLRKYEAVGI
jgi:ABC-2 type transport system permease protein